MIDPRTVFLSMPAGDGRVMVETCGALIRTANRYAGFSFVPECSLVPMARNQIVENFRATPCEWLIGVDSDIYFSMQDFECLIDPVHGGIPDQPAPTRVGGIELLTKEPNPNFGIQGDPTCNDRYLKVAGEADAIVVGRYCYKTDELKPVHLGLGFTRIHRSVFDALDELKHPMDDFVRYDISEADFSALVEDSEGNVKIPKRALRREGGHPRVWQTTWNGRTIHDYFPMGPMINALVPTMSYKGEDHGFFTLCMLAGIIPRIETRSRLVHIGRKAYQYLGEEGSGQ